MFYSNTLNLIQVGGGTQVKQGDLGSKFSYKLANEKDQELDVFDKEVAHINLVLDDKIVFTTTAAVDNSTVTFNIDKAIPVGLYFLEIKIRDYIFPSDKQTIIFVQSGAVAYDLKDLVPNYDTNMTLKGILSDLSQKGIDIKDLNRQLAEKANKDEVTNVMTPKGTLPYASLPKSGNQVGWYYYCPDGDGTHGAGNYVWNGTSWFFGGTGDEGYNLLKKDLTEYEMGAYDIELDITSEGNIDASKQIQLNLNTNKVVLTNGTKGVLKFDVVAGEKYSIDGIAEHSSDTTYPTVALAFCSDETSLITQEAGSYSYDLGIDKVDNVYGYEVTVPTDATVMYVSNRGGAKVRKITKGVNPLVGKKLGVLGDSIAYGYGYGGGFGGIIADKNNMTIQNVAVSGATVSKGVHRADGTVIPSIYDQVALLDNDCDIVVFDGCFNDRGAIEDGRIQLGTMTSIGWYGTNSFDTFCHCFENLIEALVQKFHGKPILYVYHHPIQRANDTVHESVLQMLEKWSIPYVDLSNASGGMITQIGTIKDTYTVGDTVHPNELGYKKYYVPQITAKMKTLL